MVYYQAYNGKLPSVNTRVGFLKVSLWVGITS